MTYKEYDNIFLESNNMICPSAPLVPNLVRNCNSTSGNDFLHQILDETTSHDSSGIDGTATLMTHNIFQVSYQHDNPNPFPYCMLFPSSIVRNGDYIYMETSDEESNAAARKDVIEYQISTGTITRIAIESFHTADSFNNYVGALHITYLLDRKILVAFEHNHGYEGVAPNRYYRYHASVVDFETGESTEELEWFGHYESAMGSELPEWENLWAEAVLSVEDDNGDVWGYVIGMIQHWYDIGGDYEYLSGGIFVYYKNFTQNGAWGLVRCDAGDPIGAPYYSNLESWVAANPVVIGKEKIIVMNYDFPSNYDSYPPGYTGVQMFIFDIAAQTITSSPRSSGLGMELDSYLVYDKSSNFLYFLDNYNTVSGYNIATQGFYEEIFSAEPIDYNYAMLMCDRNHAYIITDADTNLYRANGADIPSLVGTLQTTPDTFYNWHYSFVLDDNGPSVIWWDEYTNRDLYQTSITGDNLATYRNIGITPYGWETFVIHLGDCLAVVATGFRKPVDYYLVR